MHFNLKSHPIPVKVNHLRRNCPTRARTAHYSFWLGFFFPSPLLAITPYISTPDYRDISNVRSLRASQPARAGPGGAHPERPRRAARTGGRNFSRCRRGTPTSSSPLPRARAEGDAPLPCRSPPSFPAGTRKPGTPRKPRRAPAEAAGSA